MRSFRLSRAVPVHEPPGRATEVLKTVAARYEYGTDRLRWSRDLRAVFGWRARDLQDARAFFRKVHPRDVARVRQAYLEIKTAASRIGSWTLPFRLRRRDGRYADVVAQVVGLTGGPSETRSVVATLHDLTVVRAHERALQRAEELHRSVLGALREGVVVLDAKGALREANASARRLLGLKKGRLTGRGDLSRFRWFKADGHPLPFGQRPARRALRTGEPQSEVLMGRRPDGSIVWLSASAVPLPPCREGTKQGVVASFVDLTGLREAAQSLHNLSARLMTLRDDEQRRIARELHDGAAQSLTGANLILEAALRSRRRLSPGLARGLVECRALVERAGREVRTLSHLLHPRALEDGGLLPAVRELCDGFRTRSGIRVVLRAPRSVGSLPRAVATSAYRILQECLGNVLLHSRAGEVRVEVRRHGAAVRLQVCDDGRGIARRLLESVRRGVPARGIGVVGMRERAHLLGGEVEIQAGRWGTCVHVRLPTAQAA